MDDQQAVGWLHRRAGFGLHPTDLDAAASRGITAELDRFLDPTGAGIPDPVDPWADLDLDPENQGRREAVVGWMQHMLSTQRPFEDRRTWLLHGWLVSSLGKVPIPEFMVEQIRLFMEEGGGGYPELLRKITTNRAMLVYLDGRTSTGSAPNENYGRELLELFALGVGNYTESDVQAAAAALTGWVVGPKLPESVFVRRRHDDTPVNLLGVDGVNDVDSVIDAVVSHPAHARYVGRRIALEYLGDPESNSLEGVVEELTESYQRHDMALDPVIADAIRLGLDGATTPLVTAPIPWLISATRSTGVTLPQFLRAAQERVRELGQLPLLPPSVAGWPRGDEWFTASSLIARTNIAAALASSTRPQEPFHVAASDRDVDLMAQQLGLAEPFQPSTAETLRSEQDPVNRMTLALVCPENLLS